MATNDLSKAQQDQLDQAIGNRLGGPLPAGVFSAKPNPTVTPLTKADKRDSGRPVSDEDAKD